MLAKLLKYEFKATARLFIPLYVALLVFTLINRMFNIIDIIDNTVEINIKLMLSIVSMIGNIGLIAGIGVMTLVIMIQRFYKSLLGDEGYLMFTLPVKTWENVLSKLVTAVFWTLSSVFVTIISVIIISNVENIFENLIKIINDINYGFGIAGFVSIPAFFIISISSAILMFYTAIALGHQFTKHKLIASFGMFCALYFINSIIYTLVFLVFGIAIDFEILSNLLDYSTSMHLKTNITALLFSLYPLIIAVVQFLVINFILKKKLNLE
ncbi:ABC transporter permease [Herbivorax sp. ANBcel31]|uniref:ABC transporter permease n=1 Tax=Herbivorax sp. ANBcel31 TaxID=3069754 RepID=UPI0027B16E7B|nr:ABC transporter permease [Herbivorax sp. ANBcel31]MDQ2087216.1 ABC transporter permease [Herbivorax sp. ANBcel31]